MHDLFTKKLLYWHQHENNRQPIGVGETDPYKVWIREIILQQTRVEQATAYYYNLLKSFPNIESLANAPEEKVFKIWEGLGYYSRCRNMMITAKYIAHHCKGLFPNTYQECLQLKGVGDYTAAAIMSFCYHKPYAVVDGNVFRILTRYFGIHTDILSGQGKKEITTIAQQLISKKQPAEFNQAMMDFGATICTPRNPKCDTCTFQPQCFAYQHHQVSSLPIKKKKLPLENVYLIFLVIQQRQTIAVYQQNNNDIWQGLYIFPHLKIKKMLPTYKIHNKVLEQYPTLNIDSITDTYYQILTHKKIIARFVIAHVPQKINGTEWQYKKNLTTCFFPKIIKDFLQTFNT